MQRRQSQDGPHNDWGYIVPEDPWVINARFKKEGMYPPGFVLSSSTHSSRVDLHSENGEQARLRSETNSSAHSNSTLHQDSASFAGAAQEPGYGERFYFGREILRRGYDVPQESVWVYMTIQLYSIEKEFFLVDFKCAGYERLITEVVKEIKLKDTDDGQWKRLSQLGDGSNAPSLGGTRPGTAMSELHVIPEGLNGLPLDGAEVREREEIVGAGRAMEEKRATSPYPFLDVAGRLIIQLAEGGDG